MCEPARHVRQTCEATENTLGTKAHYQNLHSKFCGVNPTSAIKLNLNSISVML